ncbi:hypothetical protein NDU88_003592 [Pleurodeles waltl]|uniref:Uncharacterized protein n=1 Tax=Pleurodeles waltl TaxID=8319 RepID=A0AAV7M3T5_PLEWA|nr:hypothetical protein NDU88_003592 [Pleurodeles waltl]
MEVSRFIEREVLEVVRVKGTMITGKRGLLQVSQNVLWFKKIMEGGAGLEDQAVNGDLGYGAVPRDREGKVTTKPVASESSGSQPSLSPGSEQLTGPRSRAGDSRTLFARQCIQCPDTVFDLVYVLFY